MNEIPEDVAKAAHNIVNGLPVGGNRQAIMEGIARAILAERKRCAEIAGRTRHAEFYGNPDQMHAASFIANIIESGQ